MINPCICIFFILYQFSIFSLTEFIYDYSPLVVEDIKKFPHEVTLQANVIMKKGSIYAITWRVQYGDGGSEDIQKAKIDNINCKEATDICIQSTLKTLIGINSPGGLYIFNLTGKDEFMKEVHNTHNWTVNVSMTPLFRNTFTTDVGTGVQITCPVIGYPSPIIKWLKNDVIITNYTLYELSNNNRVLNSNLFIKAVVAEDKYAFKCEATQGEKTLIINIAIGVKDFFSWLYPLIGICLSLAFTAAIIGISLIVIGNKKLKADMVKEKVAAQ